MRHNGDQPWPDIENVPTRGARIAKKIGYLLGNIIVYVGLALFTLAMFALLVGGAVKLWQSIL